MALLVIRSNEEGTVTTPVEGALAEALESCGRAVLMVPSFQAQLAAARDLSAREGLSIGVTVTTPAAWVKERWEVWGPGTHVVEQVTRYLAMEATLAAMPESERGTVGLNVGTVDVLSQLASAALPWLPLDPAGEPGELSCHTLGLTDAETRAVGAIGRYANLIHSRGFVEDSEAMGQVVSVLRGQGVPFVPVVVAGFATMPRAQVELVCDLARETTVTVVRSASRGDSCAQEETFLSQLATIARSHGIDVESREVDVDAAPKPIGARACELSCVRDQLFRALGDDDPVDATGAVRILHPAGPLAEAESVAMAVERLVAEGASSVVVSTTDASRTWRDLAPKVMARGLSVTGEVETKVSDLDAGRAYLQFASSVANLADLAATWPDPERVKGGTRIHLGSMSWWPPRDLADFLYSDISGVPTSRAERLDAEWRNNRLLTPSDVLATLRNPGQTSPAVAAATHELLLGRIGSSASKLLMPLVSGKGPRPDDVTYDSDGEPVAFVEAPADQMGQALSRGVLGVVLNVAATLKELGLTGDPKVEGHVPLTDLVALLRRALELIALVVRPAARVEGATAEVSILPANRAASLEPLSADALVACGQTSTESAVPDGDDVLTALLVALGVEPGTDPLDEARASFQALLAVPRSAFVAERTLVDASSKECYPSVMLTELMACYGLDSDLGAASAGIPVASRGEDDAERNVSPVSRASAPAGVEAPTSAGHVRKGMRPFVLVPPQGRGELLDGKPLLSASQLETYLECPYKWFSLRRLGLGVTDAGFTPMEMGTFAHGVLEMTHRRILDEAVARAGLDEAPLTESLPGSRLLADDPEGLDRARAILSEEFDARAEAQFTVRGKRRAYQALVPHTAEDEGRLEGLRADLLDVLGYEAGLFGGFEPRLMEWDFGRGEDLVEYAGAWFNGTIDRVDVDGHGLAVVVDYKHKSPVGFAAEYGIFGKEGYDPGEGLVLPRRVQSLIYGQVVRRAHPELKVCAAVYLATKRSRAVPGGHAVAGAVSQNVADRVFFDHAPTDEALASQVVPDSQGFGMEGECGMEALLDATEEAIRAKVAELMAGRIDADPVDAKACSYCPVLNCERRLS